MPLHSRPYCCLPVMLWLLCTLACNTRPLLFTQISAAATGVQFVNEVTETDSFDIFHYPYLYAGAGVAIGDVNNDGWEDVFLVANRKGSNRLFLNKGDWQFEDVTVKAGITHTADWNTGVAMTDVNADGWLDIYISTVTIPGKLNSVNQLFLNNRNGTFTESAAQYGLDARMHTTQSAFFDYDQDGDLDCFLLNHAVNYTDDFTNVQARQKKDAASGAKLLRNDNDFFKDVTDSAGIYSGPNQYGLGIAVADLNNDGWQDLYVSNDFKENDFCYINKGGLFEDQSDKLFAHVSRFSMGNDAADYNNDGWTDVLTLDMLSPDEKILKTSLGDDDIETYNYKHQNFGFHYQFSRNSLQQNEAGRAFCDVALQQGIAATDWSWAPLLADFNNDGRKDLYVSNGFRYRTNDLDFGIFAQNVSLSNTRLNKNTSRHALTNYLPDGAVADYFFLNEGPAGFSNASADAGFTQPTLSNGCAYGDLDNDGDLDLVVNHINSAPGFYRNNSAAANHLSISLKGNGKNTFGYGARVMVYHAGNKQTVAQTPVRGFMSSVSPVLHLGLNNSKEIDSLIVYWPDGSCQRLQQVAVNRKLVLRQSDANEKSLPLLHSTLVNDTSYAQTLGLDFLHVEDAFDDLNVQPLLPHSFTTEGPALAVSDVNKDGLQDVYVGGAKGQRGALFMQTKDGKFMRTLQPAFLLDSLCEDVDAVFFDANNDGNIDLYVVSGGGQYYGLQPALPDRLYLNSGHGSFNKSNALPNLYENKSCVRPSDFDKDGDIDLFVGGRVNARMFGYPPASVLLQNNKGTFVEKTEALSTGLTTVGMVTDAVWNDVNGDDWPDLVVVGEWMPVTVFKNSRGKLQPPETIEASAGLWQCIVGADVDNDGDTDFLAGNWGTNSKLLATTKQPLHLYVHDWDNNGEPEPVMALNKEGKEYPFYGKTDLERRLPVIKKKFLKYSSFAGKTLPEIFGADALKKAKRFKATTLHSSWIENDGGRFILHPLPAFLQTTPLFSFAFLGNNRFAAGGNFYEVQPFEGRYDAGLPTLFSFQKKEAVLQQMLPVAGPVRALAPVNFGTSPGLLIARNNLPLQLFKTTDL